MGVHVFITDIIKIYEVHTHASVKERLELRYGFPVILFEWEICSSYCSFSFYLKNIWIIEQVYIFTVDQSNS